MHYKKQNIIALTRKDATAKCVINSIHFKLHKNEVEQLITQLIEEDFLNEERFAIAYAGGKFRIKQWGKEKIKYALKQKRVSDYCIRKALAAIVNFRLQ